MYFLNLILGILLQDDFLVHGGDHGFIKAFTPLCHDGPVHLTLFIGHPPVPHLQQDGNQFDGSPRKKGNTACSLNTVFAELEKAGIETERCGSCCGNQGKARRIR